MLKAGDTAPDFAIRDTTLAALAKRREVVIFFFPKAFTPGCTREAGGFRAEYAALQEKGAEVVGVSSDTQATADRFGDSLELPFPMVGDATGDVLRAYGVRIPLLGLARRVTYVVGRDGRIRHAYESQFDAQSHVTEACRAVAGGEKSA